YLKHQHMNTIDSQRTKAMLIHLAAIVSLPFMIINFFWGVMCVLLLRFILSWISKNASPYVKENIDVAYKFSIGIAFYPAIFWLGLVIVGAFVKGGISPSGLFPYVIGGLFYLYLFWLAMTIRAAVRARRGITP